MNGKSFDWGEIIKLNDSVVGLQMMR